MPISDQPLDVMLYEVSNQSITWIDGATARST